MVAMSDDPEATIRVMPGMATVHRQLHLILVVDCSGSMTGDKMASLNYAIRTAIPAIRDVAADNPEVEVRLRVLRFSTEATWHEFGPVDPEHFIWRDLTAGGETAMGAALEEVAKVLTPQAMVGRHLPPVVILVSDGQPSDDFERGLAALRAAPYGVRSLRVAVAIGMDADRDVLQDFIGDPAFRPLQANNAQDLVQRIAWATTAAIKSVSAATTDPSPLATLSRQAPSQQGSDLVW
jgi:uncharacterized protein YegL